MVMRTIRFLGAVAVALITKEYIRRIELDDRSGLGLRILLELTLTQNVLSIAKERDLERQKAVHGVPLIVKVGFDPLVQNINIINMTSDAHIVGKARQAGMIILSKSSLAELNGFK
ncbi:unnamed protein product [Penicillium palitans]